MPCQPVASGKTIVAIEVPLMALPLLVSLFLFLLHEALAIGLKILVLAVAARSFLACLLFQVVVIVVLNVVVGHDGLKEL